VLQSATGLYPSNVLQLRVAISVASNTACDMSAPRQSTKEWLPDQNAYQRAVWTVFVQHEIKDYAEFLEKLRVDWDDFEKELEAACEQRTAAVDIPDSDISRVPITLPGKMCVSRRLAYQQLNTRWDTIQRYTELMYQFFGETINWPTEEINSLACDLAAHLDSFRALSEDDGSDGDSDGSQ
jgi:hypothetical protein